MHNIVPPQRLSAALRMCGRGVIIFSQAGGQHAVVQQH